jgi:hypothetical protein
MGLNQESEIQKDITKNFRYLQNFDDTKLKPNTARLSGKSLKFVGWVEERNPTFLGLCWVSLKFNPTYKYSKPTQY